MVKIFLLDDSHSSLRQNEKIFKSLGARVSKADNGNEALSLLKKEPFDLVLCDLLMPGDDGFTVIKKIKENSTSTKIMVLSADIQEETRKKTQEMGVVNYFNKPLNNEKAQEIINGVKV